MMEIPIDSPLQLGPRHREVEDLTPRPLRSHPAKGCIDCINLNMLRHFAALRPWDSRGCHVPSHGPVP